MIPWQMTISSGKCVQQTAQIGRSLLQGGGVGKNKTEVLSDANDLNVSAGKTIEPAGKEIQLQLSGLTVNAKKNMFASSRHFFAK